MTHTTSALFAILQNVVLRPYQPKPEKQSQNVKVKNGSSDQGVVRKSYEETGN